MFSIVQNILFDRLNVVLIMWPHDNFGDERLLNVVEKLSTIVANVAGLHPVSSGDFMKL